MLKHCNLPEKSEHKTFDTFEVRSKSGGEAKALSQRLARGDDNVVFLTLMSDTGLGKSHLSIAVCRAWLSRGLAARYCFVPELLDDIRNSYKNDELTGRSHSQLMNLLETVPLLVLDDLGTEKKSEWVCETLQTIIDCRARNALPLLVTTNKPLNQLPNDDEGRIRSRLEREPWCKVVILEV